MKRLIIVVIVLVFCRPIAFARKWTDSNGKFSVEAEYVEFKDGKVHLKKQDGKIIMIPIEKFSESDQKFVKRQSSDLPSKRLINLINKLNGEDHSNAGWAAEQIGKLEGHAKAAVEPLV
ncbi:MAG: SHD1 domain-containing protein, partial [Thermoguttaceae bacterium]